MNREIRTHLKNHFRDETLWFRAKTVKPDEGIAIAISRRNERFVAEIRSRWSRKRVLEMGSKGRSLKYKKGSAFEMPALQK